MLPLHPDPTNQHRRSAERIAPVIASGDSPTLRPCFWFRTAISHFRVRNKRSWRLDVARRESSVGLVYLSARSSSPPVPLGHGAAAPTLRGPTIVWQCVDADRLEGRRAQAIVEADDEFSQVRDYMGTVKCALRARRLAHLSRPADDGARTKGAGGSLKEGRRS